MSRLTVTRAFPVPRPRRRQVAGWVLWGLGTAYIWAAVLSGLYLWPATLSALAGGWAWHGKGK
jgi:hypothetical protein